MAKTINQSENRHPVMNLSFTGLGSILVDLRFAMGGAGLAGIFAMAPWILMGWLNSKD
jgi:hypothetical protein